MIAPELAEAFRGKRVLITGGLGFIGSTLARELVEAGADVILVDSLIPEYGGNLLNIAGIEDASRVNISDVRDEHSLRYLVAGQDMLFNLAGQTSHLDSMRDPYTDLEINCRSQLSILETCRHHNPDVQGRLRQHAPDLRAPAVPPGRRAPPARARSTSTGSTRRRASGTTCSTARSTACACPCCA